MRKLKFLGNVEPITERDISEFEMKYNLTFPNEYKNFLILRNGGHCEYEEISCFFSINSNDDLLNITNTLDWMLNEFENKQWLPFGLDAGDWIWCINTGIENQGKVFLCRTDEDEKNAFRLLFDSFEQFVESLTEAEGEITYANNM